MSRRTKRTICRAVGFLLFVLMLGIVRGMDMGIMPVGKGAALALSCEIVGAAALWKGGVIRVRRLYQPGGGNREGDKMAGG